MNNPTNWNEYLDMPLSQAKATAHYPGEDEAMLLQKLRTFKQHRKARLYYLSLRFPMA